MSDQLMMARRMMYASVCAYQIYNRDTTPSEAPEPIRRIASGKGFYYDMSEPYQREVGFAGPPDTYTPAFFSDGNDDINAAMVGATHDGYAVVAIRGTIPPSLSDHNIGQWLTDWTNDGDVDPIDWRPCGAEYGKAEHGFANSANDLWPWIENQLSDIKDQCPKGVLITGHSKGGAMTYLVASLVQETWPDMAGRIEVHAFAPALSVNADFVAAYERAGLGAKTFRYQVENDLVPFLPCWTEANFWDAVKMKEWLHKIEWHVIATGVEVVTQNGYSAPGQFAYFDASHSLEEDADVVTSALPAVVKTLMAREFSKVGDAHSATDSYLLCFPPVITA